MHSHKWQLVSTENPFARIPMPTKTSVLCFARMSKRLYTALHLPFVCISTPRYLKLETTFMGPPSRLNTVSPFLAFTIITSDLPACISYRHLWECIIAPLLDYGTEVSTPNKTLATAVDRVQYRAGRTILGCSSRMPSEVVRGELGWPAMAARRDRAKLRFFHHLITMERHRMVRFVFLKRHEQTIQGLEDGWCGEIKSILFEYGLGLWWDQNVWPALPPEEAWKRLIEAVIDEKEEERLTERIRLKCKNGPTLHRYARLQPSLQREEYFEGDVWARTGTMLKTRLRGGTNFVRNSTGRFKNKYVEPTDRTCLVCNTRSKTKNTFCARVPH